MHITIDPDTLDASYIRNPWRIHDINNIQGKPHFIISQKYNGSYPAKELKNMAEKLKKEGASIFREKIELHFTDFTDVGNMPPTNGIVEVHYKCKKREVFAVSNEETITLTKNKIALSFNMSTGRPIVSVRFSDVYTYFDRRANYKFLPAYFDEEEREMVIMDTNNELDSFWPLRTEADEKLSFDNFHLFLPKPLFELP